MGLKVFVSGASGYLGNVLVAHLAAMPEVEHITGLSNNALQPAPFSPKVNFVKMDIRSPELAGVIAGHEVVIHTAFLVQWISRMPAAVRDDINLRGTRNLAQAAVESRAQKVIYASSISAYDPLLVQGTDDVKEEFPTGKGDSSMYYWNNKAIAENILTEILGPSGIMLTSLRLSYIIGPRNRITVAGFRENAANFRGRDPRAQFVHEEDVAEAFGQAVLADMPGAFNAVPDGNIRLSEVYEIIGAKPITVPLWLAHLITFVRWQYLGSPVHPSWIRSALVDATLSNAKLKAAGWRPRYSSRDAILAAIGK
jgi:Nucleoside-diphosphate-sugar epimerases